MALACSCFFRVEVSAAFKAIKPVTLFEVFVCPSLMHQHQNMLLVWTVGLLSLGL